jgi:outer membrane protein TolC
MVTTRREAYDGTCELMKKGKASYIEVLFAQEEYLKAQLADIEKKMNEE